jgi:hypothetical protein
MPREEHPAKLAHNINMTSNLPILFISPSCFKVYQTQKWIRTGDRTEWIFALMFG